MQYLQNPTAFQLIAVLPHAIQCTGIAVNPSIGITWTFIATLSTWPFMVARVTDDTGCDRLFSVANCGVLGRGLAEWCSLLRVSCDVGAWGCCLKLVRGRPPNDGRGYGEDMPAEPNTGTFHCSEHNVFSTCQQTHTHTQTQIQTRSHAYPVHLQQACMRPYKHSSWIYNYSQGRMSHTGPTWTWMYECKLDGACWYVCGVVYNIYTCLLVHPPTHIVPFPVFSPRIHNNCVTRKTRTKDKEHSVTALPKMRQTFCDSVAWKARTKHNKQVW